MRVVLRLMVRSLGILLWLVGLLVLTTGFALAHDIPAGSSLVMGDWVLAVFFIFGFAGLASMIWAYKAGLLYNIEDAKYPMLLIPEEDFYTPDWALEEEEAQA